MSAGVGVLVLAKAPVAGLAKTRVAAEIGDVAAADLAAACLLDTIDTVEGWVGPDARVIAMTGELASATRVSELARRLSSWRVVEQRGQSLGERIHHAHLDAAACWGADRVVVQVGMDTPTLSATHLSDLCQPVAERRTDAALGMAADGGWWGLVTRSPHLVGAISGVAMSRSDTGRNTLAQLTGAGVSVAIGPVLRDVDTLDDALAVVETIPHSHLADALIRLAALTR